MNSSCIEFILLFISCHGRELLEFNNQESAACWKFYLIG